jgi:hypothetical protein
MIDAHCPVLDILRAPVPVNFRLETERAMPPDEPSSKRSSELPARYCRVGG